MVFTKEIVKVGLVSGYSPDWESIIFEDVDGDIKEIGLNSVISDDPNFQWVTLKTRLVGFSARFAKDL